jgi:predicted Zn-ribbon and HTH transcriptional regulator
MRESRPTTREQIADRLREKPLSASALAHEFEIRTPEALQHVEHISRSLADTDEQLLATPPECRECGFDSFDDLVNRPSRCPECKAESVTEPVFQIR